VAVESGVLGPPRLRGDGLLFRLAHRRLGGLGLFFRRQLRLYGRRLWHLCPGYGARARLLKRALVDSSSPFGVPKPASEIPRAAGCSAVPEPLERALPARPYVADGEREGRPGETDERS
jgi:hypothetical protein